MSEENPISSGTNDTPSALPRVCDNDHELVLIKDQHRYVFRCAPGQEKQLIDQLAEMVRDPETDVDWFDAAVLSHQLGTRMNKRLKTLKKA